LSDAPQDGGHRGRVEGTGPRALEGCDARVDVALPHAHHRLHALGGHGCLALCPPQAVEVAARSGQVAPL
jgi:hypothetical protein